MKIVLVLSVLCAFAQAAPTASVVASPLLAHTLVTAPVNPFTSPLLAQVEGEAPASTVHATHVKQVVVPQVISYSIPAAIQTHFVAASPSHVVQGAPAQVLASPIAHVVHGAPAHIVSAYSLSAPIVAHSAYSIHY